jgi:hypothetical protein
MRCVLHIGTEKTGSTSIQRYLLQNRADLLAKGVHVCTAAGKGNNRAMPSAFMSNDRSDDYIARLQLQSRQDRQQWKDELLAAVAIEIAEAGHNADTFIITSEHFHSRLLHTPEVQELGEFLGRFFNRIEVICYLRRQDRMGLSLYSQVLKAGFVPEHYFPPDVSSQDQDFKLYFDFNALLKRWARVFGERNILPRIYSAQTLLNGNVVDDFLDLTGIEKCGEARGYRSNSSLSAEAMATLRYANNKLEGLDPAVAMSFRLTLTRYLEQALDGPAGKPQRREAKLFYNAFNDGNQLVARRWFGKEQLFEEDFSDYPQQEMIIDDGEILDILFQFTLSGNWRPD